MSSALLLPTLMSLALQRSCSPVVMSSVDMMLLLSHTLFGGNFSVYLLAFDQSRNAKHWRIFFLILNMFLLFMAFVLQAISCWISKMSKRYGWLTRERWSFTWAQIAVFIRCQYISSAVSCYRNPHCFSGFALFIWSLKWTSNVQELLTLRGSVGTG